jgi:hypothetical protein
MLLGAAQPFKLVEGEKSRSSNEKNLIISRLCIVRLKLFFRFSFFEAKIGFSFRRLKELALATLKLSLFFRLVSSSRAFRFAILFFFTSRSTRVFFRTVFAFYDENYEFSFAFCFNPIDCEIGKYEINLIAFSPTLQPPIIQNPQQFAPPSTGQVNGPFPTRQRSVFPHGVSDESIDATLTHFLKMMEMQYRDKHQRHGEKLDGTCEDRFFCEIAMMGRMPKADALHRMLYNVALE